MKNTTTTNQRGAQPLLSMLAIAAVFVMAATLLAGCTTPKTVEWAPQSDADIGAKQTLAMEEFEFECPRDWRNESAGAVATCVAPASSPSAEYASVYIGVEQLKGAFGEWVKDYVSLLERHGESVVQQATYEWNGVAGLQVVSSHPYFMTDSRIIPVRNGSAVVLVLLKYQPPASVYQSALGSVLESLRYSE